jgi:hypothetical protein
MTYRFDSETPIASMRMHTKNARGRICGPGLSPRGQATNCDEFMLLVKPGHAGRAYDQAHYALTWVLM